MSKHSQSKNPSDFRIRSSFNIDQKVLANVISFRLGLDDQSENTQCRIPEVHRISRRQIIKGLHELAHKAGAEGLTNSVWQDRAGAAWTACEAMAAFHWGGMVPEKETP